LQYPSEGDRDKGAAVGQGQSQQFEAL